jgi:hypothetical protein
MIRPTTSNVSALSGLVANGGQAVHDVSFSPSEIPYGGFSPVRLQIGSRSRPSTSARTRRRLIRDPSRLARSPSLSPCGAVAAQSRRQVNVSIGVPIQRPLALLRVVLSRGVVAYYGLIRGSGFLPAPYEFGGRSLPRRSCLRMRLGTRDSPIYSACPSLRAVSRTPADQVAQDCCSSTCGGLRPFERGSAPAGFPRKSQFTRGSFNEAAEFALCCGPELCRPSTDRGLLQSSFHSAGRPDGTSTMTTRRLSQLPRPDFHRQDMQPYGLRPE